MRSTAGGSAAIAPEHGSAVTGASTAAAKPTGTASGARQQAGACVSVGADMGAMSAQQA